MSFDLIPVPVWRLGRDGHVGKVVKVTAPDDSWTVVGVLTWSQVRAGLTLWADGPPSDFEGNVELTVGGWKNLHVPLDAKCLVEVPRLSLDDGETLEGVVVESALRELEAPVSRETGCDCPDVWEPCQHCGCTDAKHHYPCLYADWEQPVSRETACDSPYCRWPDRAHHPNCRNHEHEDCCK